MSRISLSGNKKLFFSFSFIHEKKRKVFLKRRLRIETPGNNIRDCKETEWSDLMSWSEYFYFPSWNLLASLTIKFVKTLLNITLSLLLAAGNIAFFAHYADPRFVYIEMEWNHKVIWWLFFLYHFSSEFFSKEWCSNLFRKLCSWMDIVGFLLHTIYVTECTKKWCLLLCHDDWWTFT